MDRPEVARIAAEKEFLSGGGEMGALMRSTDWSMTPVGPVESWPQSLKTTVRILLTSRFAMWMGWGADLTFFYNDAYQRETLGVKHPWALGKSAREVWAEIWDDVGPRAEAVLQTGVATWDEGLMLFLERSGFPEETYHTFSYSPLPTDEGAVGGMLCVVSEETERMISERRLAHLRDLASDLAGTADEDQICSVIKKRIGGHPKDLPFGLVYLFDESGATARLACSIGFESGAAAAPDLIELDQTDPEWPAAEIWAHPSPITINDLASRFDDLPTGAWDRPPRQAAVIPITGPGQDRPAGFLVAGINPYRPFDPAYAGFVDLLAGQIAASLANARAYEAERRRAESLAQIDQAKTAFFSNVSHEFRTPLTLLLGPVEDALEGRLESDQRERLEVVQRNALRLQKLVNTLLDFSRIEAGRISASYEPTDLATFSTELASVFRSAVEKAGMRLIVDCAPIGEPVFIDRDMWEKVVLNLVSNAFKFTLEGEIEVSLRREDGLAVLRVRDTGTGIPEDQLPHVFERFHRVEGARARTHEGTGIGLALVRELVGLHGGEVGVESVEGRGTTFAVAIPLGDGHLPKDRVEGPRAEIPTSLRAGHYVEEAKRWIPDEGPPDKTTKEATTRSRVLLADDNADMRDYVFRLLSARYDVQAVADGEAALAEARDWPPDLVLTDVMMPRLDGFGLLRALRADPRTQAIPVIMLSARAGEESRVEGLEAGVDDYLIKPFGARELMARVSSHLELARVRREAETNERTLRAQAEAAQEQASSILESITDGFLALDHDWRFTYVNAAAEKIVGLVRGEMIGRSYWDVFPETIASEVEAQYRHAVANQVTAEFEVYYAPLVGWFEIRAYPSKDGGLSIYFRTINDRKKAEAEAVRHLDQERVRTEQLQKLADISIRISAAHDIPSIIGVATEEARQLIETHQAVVGFTIDQNWAQSISHVSLSEKYEAWRTFAGSPDGSGIYAQVCRTNRPIRMTQAELEAHPAWKGFGGESTGHPPLRGWLAAPLIGRDGKNLGLIQLSDKLEGDFTENDEAILVQLAQITSVAVENARLYQELRENDKRKDEFLAMLAHELRNPLAAISNAVTLSTGAGLTEDAEWSMGIIGRQLKHLSRLIDDLLDVSRISRGKIVLRLGVVDVAPILDAALETVRPLAAERKHELHVSVDRSGLWANVDPTRLEQVATNLLINAAKYSENGGTIWLSAKREDGQVIIAVQDTGVGIPPDKLPEMFELFAQGDRSLARSEGGLGIGLTVVKKLVELHGGSVQARSEGHGRGSEFVVKLPSAKAPERPGVEANPTALAPRSTARILIVDDNVDTVRGMSRIFRKIGHDVRTAHSGPEAIETARDFRPECVILDIGLPGMDGYQVASLLRSEVSDQGTLIIAVSGYGQEEDRRRSREAGFDHHMVKPVDLDALLELIAQGE